MKLVETVYREILFRELEENKEKHSQKGISEKLGLSLSIVSLALKPLRRMNAIKVKPRAFFVANKEKILLYWASIRNLEKDIVLKTRIETNARSIERNMPDTAVFTCYSGFKFLFRDMPADYSEVYVYCEQKKILERFKASKGTPNLVILKPDRAMHLYGKANTKAGIFVDLWNSPEWYAKDFIDSWRQKMHGILE